MSLSRFNPRRDGNEAEIVDALRAIGVEVFYCSGRGLPDLLTHARGVWLPVEVKNPQGSNRLTKVQREGNVAAKWPIVRSVAEALALFGVVDQ